MSFFYALFFCRPIIPFFFGVGVPVVVISLVRCGLILLSYLMLFFYAAHIGSRRECVCVEQFVRSVWAYAGDR